MDLSNGNIISNGNHIAAAIQKPPLIDGAHKDWLWRKLELDCAFNVTTNDLISSDPKHSSSLESNGNGCNNINGTQHTMIDANQNELVGNGIASSPNRASNRVCLALCGLGRMGTIHLMNILKNPHVKLLYCIDSVWQRLDYISQKYHFDELGVVKLRADQIGIALVDPALDGIIISTPTNTHELLCRQALEHGKQVLCEKPLACERDAIETLYTLARERNLLLGLAFNRRYDPSLLDLKRRVELGEIGQLQVIKTCSRDSPAPPIEYLRRSGGIFHDCIIHDVDLMVWLARDLPIQVSVFAHKFNELMRDLEDYDTVSVMLKFRSGIIGLIDVSRSSAYGYDQRCEVYGTGGMLRVEDVKPVETKSHRAEGIVQAPIRYCFGSRYHDSYIIELEDFVAQVARRQGKLVASNCIPLTDNMSRPKTVLALHKIVGACHLAAREHQVVQLEWNTSEIEE